MRYSKIFNFLLFGSAMSSRNLTSLALVAIFFAVYVAAGGKISSIPKVKRGDGFGSVETADTFTDAITEVTELGSDEVTEDDEVSDDLIDDERATNLKSADTYENSLRTAKPSYGKNRGQESEDSMYEQEDLSPEDSLADIERRLKLRK